jgi:hypothetical protein
LLFHTPSNHLSGDLTVGFDGSTAVALQAMLQF